MIFACHTRRRKVGLKPFHYNNLLTLGSHIKEIAQLYYEGLKDQGAY